MEGIEAGLPVLVMNVAVGTEHGQCVIESLIGRARSGTAGGLRGGVEPVKRSELLGKSMPGVVGHPLKGASGKARRKPPRSAKPGKSPARQTGRTPVKAYQKLRAPTTH